MFCFSPIIDDARFTGETLKQNTRVDQDISEPLSKKPKEEEVEYDISWRSDQQHGQGETEIFITPHCVKNDPEEEEEDTSMPSITDMFHIKVVEYNANSSGTLSANEDEDEYFSDSDAVTDDPRPYRSEESTSESRDTQTHDVDSTKSATVSLFLGPRAPLIEHI